MPHAWDDNKREWVRVPDILEIVARLKVLEAAEKKRSDREDQALRALRSDWVNERGIT